MKRKRRQKKTKIKIYEKICKMMVKRRNKMIKGDKKEDKKKMIQKDEKENINDEKRQKQ